MRVCEFCGKELPNEESFCGYCGRTTRNSPETPAGISGLPTVKQAAVDAANPISALDWEWEDGVPGNINQPGNAAQLPASDEDEDEAKRRRAAILGIGLGVLAEKDNSRREMHPWYRERRNLVEFHPSTEHRR